MMENKEIISAGKMTQRLIGYWLLWGIPIGILWSNISTVLTSSMESIILKAIIGIIGQGFINMLLWSLSTTSSFKKKTITLNDVQKIMRNLIIFIVLICTFNVIYNVTKANISINKVIADTESKMSIIYSKDEIQQYNNEKEKNIKQVKKQINTYLVILEIGVTSVYLIAIPLEKKEILKYTKNL